MFTEFRQYVKNELKRSCLTYANLAESTGLRETTIKCFMCGRDDSRRVAEKIADALGIIIRYSNQTYTIEETINK